MEDSRAERLTAFVDRVSGAQDFPALAGRIRDVMQILASDGRTMQHLANVILKDYSLTAKVLRTANSLTYNRAGTPVVSVTQAMVLLGVDAVRELASSLIVFEHYQRQSPGLRELMVLSMLTAAHARDTAEHLGYGRPEEAHLIGMFRNLGEVLVACHAPAEYAAILTGVRDGDRPAGAALRVLGFTYEELGEAICRAWGIDGPSGPRTDRDLLDRIVDFSHELTTSVYRRDGGPSATTLTILTQKHGSALGLSPELLPQILDRGIGETREVFKSLSVSFNDLKLRHQCEAALTVLSAAEPPHEGAAEPSLAPGIVATRERLTAAIADTIAAPGFDLNHALLTILEAVLRAGPFDRAVFCVANADRSEAIGRFGLGDEVDAWLDRLRFPISSAPSTAPIGPALARAADLVLSTSDTLTPDAAQWLRRLDVRVLVLLPVVVDHKFVGVVCAQRRQPEPPDTGTLDFIRRARSLMVEAVGRARVVADPARRAAVSAEVRYEAVLRVLRGDAPDVVSRDVGVPRAELERWHEAFLSGAKNALTKSP